MTTDARLPRPKPGELFSRTHWSRFATVVWQRRWSLAIILAVVSAIHASGALHTLDVPVVDTWLSMMAQTPAASVRVVAISKEEFEKLWGDPRRRAESLK